MIQGWYCKEKLDAGHSLGVKRLMLQTWSKSDLQLPYHSKLFFAIKTIPSGYLPDSHETNTLDHKGFLFVGKTVAKQTKITINVYITVNSKNEKNCYALLKEIVLFYNSTHPSAKLRAPY